MSKTLRRTVIANVVVFLIAVIVYPHALALSPGSTLTTSPVAVYLTAKPGSTVTTTLQVQNNGPVPVAITLKLEEFKAAGENGEAQIIEPATSDITTSWVHFSQNTIQAIPGVWNKVTMTINVPTSAAFGYYYAVLFSPDTTISSQAQKGTVNTVKGANAILVLLDAHAPGESRQLQIKQFVSDRSVYQYLPANFNVTVHNGGNVFAAPQGDVYISRTENGPPIETLPINTGQGNILPATDRVFQVAWNNGFPVYQQKRVNGQIVSDNNGKPEQILNWDINKITSFRFGRYYARLVLVYNNGTRDIPLTEDISFWVIPWLPLIVVFVILALGVVGFLTILRIPLKRARLPWKS